MTDTASQWCILRTSGPRTLLLAKSLNEAGIAAWTPTGGGSRRRPRSRDRIDYEVPILPTFVFAKAGWLAELNRCRDTLANPHPPFSIFHYCGTIPIVSDDEISSLRAAESDARRDAELARRKSSRHTFRVGNCVRLDDDSAFAGMTGIVKDGDDKFALVSFGGNFVLKIATFLLSPDALQDAQPDNGTAAQAA